MSFGKGDDSGQLIRNVNVSTPAFGLSSTSGDGTLSASLTRKGSAPQKEFGIRFPKLLGRLDTLSGTVRPGFSNLRLSRLAQVRDAGDRAISNLKDNLARRRVKGSSFGFDALTRAELEKGKALSEVEGQVFLEELAANQQLIQQETAFLGDALNRELTELGVAADFSVNTAQLVSENVRFDKSLAAQSAQAVGSFVGNIAGLGLSTLGAGGMFGQGGRFGSSLPSPITLQGLA